MSGVPRAMTSPSPANPKSTQDDGDVSGATTERHDPAVAPAEADVVGAMVAPAAGVAAQTAGEAPLDEPADAGTTEDAGVAPSNVRGGDAVAAGAPVCADEQPAGGAPHARRAPPPGG